jgi:mxaL protein
VNRPGRDSHVLIAALVLLVIALVMPRWKVGREVFDYIVIFDVTQSMDVEDYDAGGTPVSRLNHAREAMRWTLRQLPCGSRIGWGAFTEYRSLLLLTPVEVCENYNDLIASLDNIDGRMRWANASEVGKGVYWSVRVALSTESKPDVIFISDGHEAPPLEPGAPISMPEDVQPGQVRGLIVGAGSDAALPIPKTDDDDRRVGYWSARDVVQLVSPDGTRILSTEHLSALHEPHLKALAGRVGFGYLRLTTPESLAAAMRDARFARRAPAPTDFYWVPLGLALALLVVHFRPDGWWRGSRNRLAAGKKKAPPSRDATAARVGSDQNRAVTPR